VDHVQERATLFIIADNGKDQRIDLFLSCQMEDLTRSRIQALIRDGFVTVNGKTPKISYRLKKYDQVRLVVPPAKSYHIEPEEVEFSLIYEDDSLLVLNKPPGLVIHPAPGHPGGTLVHGLLQHCRDLSGIGGVMRPGIVHRLDKDTSGVLVVAKNDKAHASLARQFKEGAIKKQYKAIVHGIMGENKGEIDLPIGRHPIKRKEMAVLPANGRIALTRWQIEEEIGNNFSVLSVRPRTGRTHQIRVHLSHEGHPIVGDSVYGHKKKWWKTHFPLDYTKTIVLINRQMLHAQTLGFVHPTRNEYCEYTAEMPDDMQQTIDMLRGLSIQMPDSRIQKRT
jgi:23S rRNA pseudouridine1911/1915/1917 synthase